MLRTGLAVILLLTTPDMAVGREQQRDPASDRESVSVESVSIEPVADPPDSARNAEVLTLADLERIARRHNPTLAAASARTQIARGRRVQEGLYPNPVVGYHAVEMGLRGTSGQQGGFITQRIITGGKLDLDQAIAGADINAAHFRFRAQQQRVLSDVRIRFYTALAAQRRVELTGRLAHIGDELVQATETLLAGRQGTENDLLQAEIKADESRILLANSENEQIESWRRLTAVVGVPSMKSTPLSGQLDARLPEFDWDTCSAAVLRSNPRLNAARTRVQRARIALQRARREPIPDIDLMVSHRHHNVTDENVTNVQVGIPIPVFDRNQGNICSAQAEWVTACHEFKRIELDLQDQLAVAYRRYANARQQVERYGSRMVPRATRSLKLVTEGYQTGQVEYPTLLTSQQTFLQVSLSWLESLRELRTASSIIEGQLLSGSLTDRN